MQTIFYIFYFDSLNQKRYLPFLDRLWDGLLTHCPHIPTDHVKVLTNQETVLDEDNFNVVRTNPDPYLSRYARPNNQGFNFDYKACMLMDLFDNHKFIPGTRTLVMDADNIVLRDFTQQLDDVQDTAFAIAPDGGERTIRHPAFTGEKEECSSNLMLFPADPIYFINRYRELWDSQVGQEENEHLLKEQRTWSLVYHADEARNHLFPRTMSWSRFWGAPPASTYITHPHGQEKWDTLYAR